MNPAIKILVVKRVFIMPNASDWASNFVANVGTAIGSRNGLDRIDDRSSPGSDGIGRSHRRSNGLKGETRRAADSETTVGYVVVHVALPRIRLAPGVLMRSDVLSFGIIRRTRIHRRVEVVHFHAKPVHCARA